MAETTEKPHHYQVRSVDTSITMQQPALDIKKHLIAWTTRCL